MYTIGQFSIITKFSTKTLRYYDEINLLKPAKVNYENNYRYYDDESLLKAQQIAIYRSCDISIERIRKLLFSNQEKNDLKEILKSQFSDLNNKLTDIKYRQSVLQKIINDMDTNNISKVKIKQHREQHVISLRERGTHDSIGNIISRLFELANSLKLNIIGSHTIIWYEDKDFNNDDIDMEIYIPIEFDKSINSEYIKILKCQDFCELEHIGSISTLSSTYKEMYSFIKKNKLKVMGAFEETYITNKKYFDPSQLKINIAVPVEEDL